MESVKPKSDASAEELDKSRLLKITLFSQRDQ